MAMEHIGKYKIIKELGAGGFGAVYLAQDPNLGTQVAIKVFQVKDENLAGVITSASQDAGTVLKGRFLAEARTLEQLSANPYIVNHKYSDEMPDGTPYYVMPYLPNSLENEIGKDAFTRGKLEETPKELHPRKLASSRALEILKQILEGMSAVHKAGLIHRDLKPANILFDSQGTVQICDFGIAKLPDAEHSQSGVGMGSRNYMSPEQRESAKHVSPASDVYSVGVLAYRMLTGQLPGHPYEPPIQFSPAIGQPLNDIIDTAIAQQEGKRPADAGAFLKQLIQAVKLSTEDLPEDDGGTGTDVDDSSVPDIKPQLKPLQQKIEHILRKEGQIGDKHNLSLQAMASVAGLSEAELEDFIAVTEKQLGSELTPFRNWLDFVESQAKTHEGKLDSTTMDVLLEAGQPLGKDTDTLREHINGVCGRYSSPDNTVKPPSEKPKTAAEPKPASQPKSKTVPKSTTNNDPKMGHTKTETPPRLASKPGNSATQDHTNTYQRRNTTLLAGLGAVVAVGVGIWLYSSSEQATQSGDGVESATLEDKTYQVNGTSFVLKGIPGGSFQMGSNNGANDEKPVHRVSIKPFRLMATEVTWAMYQPCIDAGVCTDNQDKGGDEGWGKGNRPVINVSWNNITQEYIPWLKQQTGQTFRLPSEAEWEYAARAGSTTKYSWGDSISCSQARYGRRSGGECSDSQDGTVAIKSFAPNAFGLYDMHGNVWEWVQDCWNGSYNGAPTKGSAWMQGNCDLAVLRGGSWGYTPFYLRSATRSWNNPSYRTNNNGFRLAQGE